jgi:hypothetical protein
MGVRFVVLISILLFSLAAGGIAQTAKPCLQAPGGLC